MFKYQLLTNGNLKAYKIELFYNIKCSLCTGQFRVIVGKIKSYNEIYIWAAVNWNQILKGHYCGECCMP